MDKVKLAKEAGELPGELKRLSGHSRVPAYLARLDYALMDALGVAPSINAASARWGVSFGVARRIIDEVKILTVAISEGN